MFDCKYWHLNSKVVTLMPRGVSRSVLKFFVGAGKFRGVWDFFLEKPQQIEKISQKGVDPQNPSLNTPLLMPLNSSKFSSIEVNKVCLIFVDNILWATMMLKADLGVFVANFQKFTDRGVDR